MVAKSPLDASMEWQTQFVEPEAYLHLLTSRRSLERADDPAGGLLGLLDRESRVRFVVEEQQVWQRRGGVV